MPNARKTALKSQLPSKLRSDTTRTSEYCDHQSESDGNQPGASLIVSPQHTHVPDAGLEYNLGFEGFAFMFGAMALLLQYINLYKTVWWLPQSHSKYALNFYLIDPYLSVLLILIMSRRLVYVFLKEFYSGRSVNTCTYYMVKTIKVVVVLALSEILCYCAYNVVVKYSLLYSLFLCYPLATYTVLFGFNLKPLLGKALLIPSNQLQENSKGTPIKHRYKDSQLMKEVPVHVCSMTPEVVREEVEYLKTDFNCRIKQVLFNSMTCAYYMGFVPLCFAQRVADMYMGFIEDSDEGNFELSLVYENTLYYDTWWVGQHVCLVWISSFIMFMVHFLPARYLDTLHQSALHLGKWGKVEGRHAHVPYNAWSELQVWQKNSLVKHVKGLFKAEGINNSAEPGNTMHTRFHFMFHQACRLTNWLLTITLLLVIYQFVQLLQSSDWSHIISMSFLILSNYAGLFRLMRNRFIIWKAYKDDPSSNNGLWW